MARTSRLKTKKNGGNGWFHTWDADDDLGWELGLYGDYQYSEDLVFRAGWAHFFAGDGLNDNASVLGNGYFNFVGDDARRL